MRSSRGRRSTAETYPNGISGTNGAQITGIGDLREAKDLALVLQTGALPVTFKTLEQTAISATLGKDSLAEAKLAAFAGLLVVALFLLIFYRVLGLVAVLGLCIYAALLYAAILVFNVTLTLPGFAGMILTLGVAADANVVIFERVKEECARGQIRAGRDRSGLRQGLRDHHRRQRRDGDHGDRPLPRRHRRRQGLRPDAPHRDRDLVAHGRRRDARDPRLARGLQVVRQPELMGAQGEPPRWIRRDFIGLRNLLVRDLWCLPARSRSARSPSRG